MSCGDPLPSPLTLCSSDQDCGQARLCIGNVCVASGKSSTNEPSQEVVSTETNTGPEERLGMDAPQEQPVGSDSSENPATPDITEPTTDRSEWVVDQAEATTDEPEANEQDGGSNEAQPETIAEPEPSADTQPEVIPEPSPELPQEVKPETSPENAVLCNPGETRTCFRGSPTQINVGICKAGTQSCGSNRTWGACVNEVPPSLEICDGKDNDCNGKVDDNISFTSPTCRPNPLPTGAYCQTVATQCNNGLLKCDSGKVSTLLKTSPGLSEGWLSPCTQALFDSPEGIAADAAGNLFFAESGNHAIRKIDVTTGEVTRIAGGLGAGYVDGTPSQAKFNYPIGISVDSRGRIFVADRYNHVIRLIQWISNGQCGTSAGYTGYCVSTIAGKAGEAKADDGPGLLARFNNPFGLALNNKNELFVADFNNHLIRKITFVTKGKCDKTQNFRGFCVETYAGSKRGFKDGKGTQAEFYSPAYLTAGPKGTLYVSDRGNHVIRTIDTKQDVKTLAGSGRGGRVDGKGNKAQFYLPQGLTLDAKGNLYVVDQGNHTVRKITPSGDVSTYAGKAGFASATNGLLTDAGFYYPNDITTAPDGRMFVTDSLNDMVRVIDSVSVRNLAGVRGNNRLVDGKTLCARIREPIQGARDAQGRIYFTDRRNHVIFRLLPTGYLEVFAGTGIAGFKNGHRLSAQFSGPIGLDFDKLGNLYVADPGNHIIRMITPSDNVVTLAGIPRGAGLLNNVKRDKAKFNRPNSILVDGQGNLLIADSNNHCVRKLDVQTEMVSRFAGTCARSGTLDGAPGTGQLSRPVALRLNAQGTLYIASFDSGRIRSADSTGKLSTVAGGTRGFKDGTGAQAQFWAPRNLTLTSTGDLLVADPFNYRIRLLDTLSQGVSTRAGRGNRGSSDDYALLATFDDPFDILPYNNQGDWLILDGGNSTLRLLPGCR